LQGAESTEDTTKQWRDPRAHHLYALATASKDGNMRREALHFLGALERAGSEDAAWAMDIIRRKSREGEGSPPSSS
jgi:hypothetical protein